jgi:predicted nucleotidyltransferase
MDQTISAAVAASRLFRLAEAFECHAEVLSAYLFGSTVGGHARKGSDIDLAVRLLPELSVEERFDLRLKLIEEIEKLVESTVDVVVMNDTALIMLHQIFSRGIPVFIRHPDDEERYRILKQKEFFDFRYYLDRDFSEMKRFFGATACD